MQFGRDFLAGMTKPRGFLMILCFVFAIGLVGLQVSAEQRLLVPVVIGLLAIPSFLIWGAYVGLSRRVATLEGARGGHGSNTEHLDRWCADLANRISHLENVGSQLQASEAAQASMLEALRSNLLSIAKIAEQADLAKLSGRVGLLEDAALAQAVNMENQLRQGSKAGAEL